MCTGLCLLSWALGRGEFVLTKQEGGHRVVPKAIRQEVRHETRTCAGSYFWAAWASPELLGFTLQFEVAQILVAPWGCSGSTAQQQPVS